MNEIHIIDDYNINYMKRCNNVKKLISEKHRRLLLGSQTLLRSDYFTVLISTDVHTSLSSI